MLKKMTVLAMAAGAVAAFALPTSASANWQHHGVELQENVDIPLTGQVRFQGGIGGVECQITSTATFFGKSSTGQADTFDVPGSETTLCEGLGGLAPCEIHNVSPQTGISWQFHQGAWKTVTAVQGSQTTFGTQHPTAVIVTPGTITSELTGGIFCLVEHVLLHPGEVGLTEEEVEGPTVGDGKTVTNVDVNGSAIATIQTKGGATTTHTEETIVQGTLQIENQAQRNTYDI